MLSKVEWGTEIVKYSFTWVKNFSNSRTEIITYTPTKTTTIRVKWQLKTNCNARFDFMSWDNTLKSITSTTNTLVNVNETFDNITVSNGLQIKAIRTSWGSASAANVTFSPIEILEELWITIPEDFKRGKPRELKAIGNKASTTIFWVHTDNSRVSQS